MTADQVSSWGRAIGPSGCFMTHVALRRRLHVQVRQSDRVPQRSLIAGHQVAPELPPALKIRLARRVWMRDVRRARVVDRPWPFTSSRASVLRWLRSDRNFRALPEIWPGHQPLTFVTCVTNLSPRGITEKEMALIPATIPSLWVLILVRPSEPLTNHSSGPRPARPLCGESLCPCASGTPLTTSHRCGRAARWPLA